MTMQSSGAISMYQAMIECQLSAQSYNAGSTLLSTLANVSSGQAYAWSYWYGKTYGYPINEVGTQLNAQNYSVCNNYNFAYNGLWIYGGGWAERGGQSLVSTNNNMPTTINGHRIAGFYRSGAWTTVIIANGPGSGLYFWSSIGDHAYLDNNLSYSWAIGSDLWTGYAVQTSVYQGSPRSFSINLSGTTNGPQPPANYINNQPPVSSGTSTGDGGGGGCCFVAGSMVLMADRSWKPVEKIEAGDILQGPAGIGVVKRLHVARLESYRSMMTMREDPSIMWSEEHPFWAEQDGKQWWWSANPDHLRAEMESGLIAGLKNPHSVLKGNVRFAHIHGQDGFVDRTPVKVSGYHPDTLVYIPVVEGSPCIINGYVVGAFLNERGFDYSLLDWRKHYKGMIDVHTTLDEVLKPWLDAFQANPRLLMGT